MKCTQAGQLISAAALLGAVISACVGSSLAKGLFPVVGAEGASGLRVGFSAMVLLLWYRPWRWPLNRRDAMLIAFYGAALGLTNVSFYLALRTIPLGIALAIAFCGPLAIALMHSRRPSDGAWLVLAAVGLWALLPFGHQSTLDAGGAVLAMVTATCWACYILAGKRASRLPTGQCVSLGMCVAGLIAVPLGVAHAGTKLLAIKTLAGGLAVAVISSAIPCSLELVAIRGLGAGAFGVLVSLEPAVASLLGMLMLRENLRVTQWLAVACIVAASMGRFISSAHQVTGCARTSNSDAPERAGEGKRT